MASRAQTPHGVLRWSRNRGRNGWDVPTDIADDMTAESMNVILEKNTLGRKRRGSATQSIIGTSFTGYNALYRHVPGQSETAAEIFIVSDDSPAKILRVAGGTSASALSTAISSSAPQVRFATLNGKCFIAFDSTANRLHVWDGTNFRAAGFATPAAATVADQGTPGTAYSAVLRYYRIQWLEKSGSTILRQGLLGTAVSFTPDGGHTDARITRPTAASEQETHWRIWASADGDLYYFLADVAIATTTYDDHAVVADYDLQDPAPDEGAFTPFPSTKFILSTGERLLGFGVWETSAGDSLTPRAGRVYFTPTLDASDEGDDERVSNTVDFEGWIDVGRNAGAEDRGLGGPLHGGIFVFQSRGIYMLVETGDATQPYRRVCLTTDLGAVSQESIFLGEDELGRPCLYFLDPFRGPYRYGALGFEWLGYDVKDIIDQLNLAATVRVAAGMYDPELRACIFGVSSSETPGQNNIRQLLVFFVREGRSTGTEGVRGGWVRWAEATPTGFYSMAMLPETIGATMSAKLKPYLGSVTVVRRWDDTSSTQDGSSSFQAYVTSKAFDGSLINQYKRLGKTHLQATASSGVTIRQTLTRNFGDETARTADALLTAAGSETRVTRKFEDAALARVLQMQVTLGDSAAANNTWTLDEWVGTWEPEDEF